MLVRRSQNYLRSECPLPTSRSKLLKVTYWDRGRLARTERRQGANSVWKAKLFEDKLGQSRDFD
jgi:hypothetical protein